MSTANLEAHPPVGAVRSRRFVRTISTLGRWGLFSAGKLVLTSYRFCQVAN